MDKVGRIYIYVLLGISCGGVEMKEAMTVNEDIGGSPIWSLS